MRLLKFALTIFLLTLSVSAFSETPGVAKVDKLMAHYDRAHSGWNAEESHLSPGIVASESFGSVWSSPQLDSFGDVPPRVFSGVLVKHGVTVSSGRYEGQTFTAAYLATTTGYAYAINVVQVGDVEAGTILWRTRLTDTPCYQGKMGTYSTPVIDDETNQLYVTVCSDQTGKNMFDAYAIDIRSGETLEGWPLNISQAMMDQPSLNKNGTRTWRYGFPGYRWVQRGSLNLSRDGSRLYVAFGADGVGWMVVVDTKSKSVDSAFSATPDNDQDTGGMWASGGPSIDQEGRIYMTTGSNLRNGLMLGLAGVYADKENSWGHSILQWVDDRENGLTLVGTYTPYNYCQAAKADIDIGSSAPIVIDLPQETTSTPNLLVLGGGKQGNIYLLDRNNMPGSLVKRQPCTIDPADDTSLLAPEIQPEWKRRGPINLFKPFSDEIGAFDQAKSRTTSSYFRDDLGNTYVYVTGSSKKGENFNTSMPPGLAKVGIVTSPGEPAFLRLDKLETKTTLHNPGSPIITSNGGRNAIVWVVDQNAPRTANLYGESPPDPVLYAFDALTLDLIWQSEPGKLFTTGNYGEPTIVDGVVLVGTDRLQAFGKKQQ